MLSALCAPLRAALADTLSLRQQRIVAIASAATGALEHLRTALARGLDGGADCERGQGSDGARLCLLRLPRSLRGLQPPSCKCSTSAERGASPTLWGATRKPVCDSRDKHTRARSCSKS